MEVGENICISVCDKGVVSMTKSLVIGKHTKNSKAHELTRKNWQGVFQLAVFITMKCASLSVIRKMQVQSQTIIRTYSLERLELERLSKYKQECGTCSLLLCQW